MARRKSQGPVPWRQFVSFRLLVVRWASRIRFSNAKITCTVKLPFPRNGSTTVNRKEGKGHNDEKYTNQRRALIRWPRWRKDVRERKQTAGRQKRRKGQQMQSLRTRHRRTGPLRFAATARHRRTSIEVRYKYRYRHRHRRRNRHRNRNRALPEHALWGSRLGPSRAARR